ncbi:MAG: leucine-rich repeat protein [Prevotellaceae bacterium]|jgi:hypothetical protein|nr:leucine-rich repeat protein [Prevotellaceae bacterium]
MKRIFLLLTIIVCFFTINKATAQQPITSGTTGDCQWMINLLPTGDYQLEIVSLYGIEVLMADYNDTDNLAPWYTYKGYIKSLKMSNVMNIGNFAFANCTGLTSVTIPPSVITIGEHAFANCTGLGTLTFGNLGRSIAIIGDKAFYRTALTSVSIADETTLGNAVFADCPNLTKIEVLSSNPQYSVQDGILFNKLKDTLLQYPAGKTTTGYTIPLNVATIANSAFEGSRHLTSITLDGVMTIEEAAFRNCDHLTSLIIPALVTTIGDHAFENCSDIKSITLKPTIPPELGVDAFKNVSADVFVHCNTEFTYKAAPGWNNLGDNLPYIADPFYKITLKSFNDDNMEYGRVFVTSREYICLTAQITIKAEPNEGYEFAGWTDDLTGSAERTVTISDNAVYQAIFVKKKYLVTIASANTDMGLVEIKVGETTYPSSGNGSDYEQVSFDNGTEVTVRAIARSGYNFLYWNDGKDKRNDKANPRTFTITNEDLSFIANFADGVYVISASQELSGQNDWGTATVDGVDEKSYRYEEKATLEAFPAWDKLFVDWDDGSPYNPHEVTVTRSHHYTANFEHRRFKIRLKLKEGCEGMGTFSSYSNSYETDTDGAYVFVYSSESFGFEATATEGSRFVRWIEIDEIPALAGHESFKGKSGDSALENIPMDSILFATYPTLTFTAEFQSDHNVYTYQLKGQEDRGDVTVMNKETGKEQNIFVHGGTALILAKPSGGYKFMRWNDGNPGGVPPHDLGIQRDVIVTRDTSFLARFAAENAELHWLEFTPKIVAGGIYSTGGGTFRGANGDITDPEDIYCGTGMYAEGEEFWILANPDQGNKFVRWNEDGNLEEDRYIRAGYDDQWNKTSSAYYTAIFVENNVSTCMIKTPTKKIGNTDELEWGTITGGGRYAVGETVKLEAKPVYAGDIFVGWDDDNDNKINNTDNPRTFVISADMGGKEKTYTAVFANQIRVALYPGDFATGKYCHQEDEYIDTEQYCEYGDVVVEVGGGIAPPNEFYPYGTVLKIKPNPSHPSCNFVQWSDGNKDNPRTVTITQDTLFVAQFEQIKHTITLNANDPTLGTVGIIRATNGGGPDDNYVVGASSYEVLYGDLISIVADALGNRFVRWEDNVNGNVTGDADNTSPIRKIKVDKDITFKAVFAKESYTVTVASNNAVWGSAYFPECGVACTEMTCATGEDVKVATLPKEGYAFRLWWEGTVGDKNNSIERCMTGDCVITVDHSMTLWAEFQPQAQEHELKIRSTFGSIVVTSDGKTLNPSKEGEVYKYNILHGTEIQMQVTGMEDLPFKCEGWDDNGDGLVDNSNNPRKMIVNRSMTVEAIFPVYTLEVISNNPNWGWVSLTPEGPYKHGTKVEMVANAIGGYHLSEWSDTKTNETPRTITMTKNEKINATFASNTALIYKLKVESDHPEWGTVGINPQNPLYHYEEQVVLTPTAKDGYRFLRWLGDTGDTQNPRPVSVQGNMAFTASFIVDTEPTYLIVARPNNAARGIVDGGGTYYADTQVELRATPFPGYYFSRWTDNNKDMSRRITVSRDMTYIAVFEEGEGDTPENPIPFDPTVVVYPNPVRDVLYIRSAAAVEQVVILTLSGQLVKQIASPTDKEIDVRDLAKGVYLVRVKTAIDETMLKIVISD